MALPAQAQNQPYAKHEEREEAKKLYENTSMSVQNIATKVCVDTNTVYKWAKKGQWKKFGESEIAGMDINKLTPKTINDLLNIRNTVSDIIAFIQDNIDNLDITKAKGVMDTLITAHKYLLETNTLTSPEAQIKVEIVRSKNEG